MACCIRLWGGCGDRSSSGWFTVIKNARASLAVKHLFARRAPHFLDYVRANAHAAGPAFLVANLGERDVIMLVHDAVVMIEHVLGNFRGDAGALFGELGQLFFSFGLVGVEFRAKPARDFFHFLQQLVGRFDAAVVFLAIYHLFEQAIFGFGDFCFGHFHFVLQRFVGFVGFYLRSLIFVFAYAVFVLFDVEFVFLAVFDGSELGGFGGVEFSLRAVHASFDFGGLFGEFSDAGADGLQAGVHALKLHQVLEDLDHDGAILAQRCGRHLRLGLVIDEPEETR